MNDSNLAITSYVASTLIFASMVSFKVARSKEQVYFEFNGEHHKINAKQSFVLGAVVGAVTVGPVYALGAIVLDRALKHIKNQDTYILFETVYRLGTKR